MIFFLDYIFYSFLKSPNIMLNYFRVEFIIIFFCWIWSVVQLWPKSLVRKRNNGRVEKRKRKMATGAVKVTQVLATPHKNTEGILNTHSTKNLGDEIIPLCPSKGLENLDAFVCSLGLVCSALISPVV